MVECGRDLVERGSCPGGHGKWDTAGGDGDTELVIRQGLDCINQEIGSF